MPPAFPRPATRSSIISSRSMSLIRSRRRTPLRSAGREAAAAIGTTVARALEAAGTPDGTVRAGNGVVTGGIGAGTKLPIVDALLTGAHEPGTSRHALLGVFLDETMLRRVDAELAASHHRTHEFGDSVLIERSVGI